MSVISSRELVIRQDEFSFYLVSPPHYGMMLVQCDHCEQPSLIFIDSDNRISNQEVVSDQRFPGRYFLVCPHCERLNTLLSEDYHEDNFEELRIGGGYDTCGH